MHVPFLIVKYVLFDVTQAIHECLRYSHFELDKSYLFFFWILLRQSYCPSFFFSFSNNFVTTSTTLLSPSISSSTVPPIPALAKLIELPTYTGFASFLARTFAKRVVKSNVPAWVNRGVLSVSVGDSLYGNLISWT